MGYTSDIIDTVRVFLTRQDIDASAQYRQLSDIKAVAIGIGYGEPFDREQRALNDLLYEAKASDELCLKIWSYYHDMKINEAMARRRKNF